MIARLFNKVPISACGSSISDRANTSRRTALWDEMTDSDGVNRHFGAGKIALISPIGLIPPRKRAQLTRQPSLAMRQRNRNIRAIARSGRRQWLNKSGYSRRAIVENTIGHYKAIFGPSMRARSLAGQRLEARLGCRILNEMTALGMPDSVLAV